MKGKIVFLSIMSVLAVLLWTAVLAGSEGEKAELKVAFCDVGQGDAIFITFPGGAQILIDGGPDNTVLDCLGEEMPYYDRTIDWIVVTHPDADHIGGLPEVLRRYEVGNILTTGVIHDTKLFETLESVIEAQDLPEVIAQAGGIIESGGVQAAILFPFSSLEGTKPKDMNGSSIVLKVVYGETEVLLTGDAEKKAENALISHKADLEADILKAGHHGSKGSTTFKFYEEVNPEIVVFSAGEDNRYGHPAPEIIKRVSASKIYRTDVDGTVKLVSDGVAWQEY